MLSKGLLGSLSFFFKFGDGRRSKRILPFGGLPWEVERGREIKRERERDKEREKREREEREERETVAGNKS